MGKKQQISSEWRGPYANVSSANCQTAKLADHPVDPPKLNMSFSTRQNQHEIYSLLHVKLYFSIVLLSLDTQNTKLKKLYQVLSRSVNFRVELPDGLYPK